MTSPSSLERSSVSTTVVLVAVIDTAGLEKRAGLARNDDEGVEGPEEEEDEEDDDEEDVAEGTETLTGEEEARVAIADGGLKAGPGGMALSTVAVISGCSTSELAVEGASPKTLPPELLLLLPDDD